MKFRKIAAVLLVAAMAVTTLAGCGASSASAAGDDKTVTIWAEGSDNVRVQLEQQVENFNETNGEGYVAKLEFITSGTGAQGLTDRIIAAKKAGQTNTDYDLVEVSDASITGYLEQGGEDLFVPIDTSRLSNYDNLTVTASFRNDLLVPYRGTTVLLAYNSETVANPPTTAEELYQWIKDNPGRFAYNTPGSGGAGSSFVLTSVYNFMDESALTSTDEANVEQWDQGFELLKELHPYMYQSSGKVVYPNKNQGTLDLLANKEIDMTPAWADMVLSQQKQGTMPESIKLVQIEPAFTGNTVCFGIPSIGAQNDAAYAFMDYMLSPEAQNIALDSMAAIPVIDFSLLDPELTKTISDLKIESFRVSAIGDLGTQLNEKWDAEIGTLE
ncbi:MAG TPA: extracellular solute-binding protein [Candidatus Eisenbergiella intestinigallinarum]|uniref:Extracellular solute-binding protein n=1 Tax=Candidatus Eisenbergiella intestinigallinarum TaxID=2838549 RepID=A0A9D2QLN2_9FIRM|nr:extracellular solute-binding protein [Candidatus Eisenbergiella intestinigallinarum]